MRRILSLRQPVEVLAPHVRVLGTFHAFSQGLVLSPSTLFIVSPVLFTHVRRRGVLRNLRPLRPAFCISRLWRDAAATVLPLGYRGRSLHLVAPHTDARGRDSNMNLRRVIDALLTPLDPSLTLTRAQHPAIVCKTGNRKPVVYAGFAILCNAQQPLPAHS